MDTSIMVRKSLDAPDTILVYTNIYIPMLYLDC